MISRLISGIVILVLALGLLPGGAVSAADPPDGKWVLRKTVITPPGGTFEHSNIIGTPRTTITEETSTETWSGEWDAPVDRTILGGTTVKQSYNIVATFDFDKPPATLTPGEIVTLKATGTVNYIGEAPSGEFDWNLNYGDALWDEQGNTHYGATAIDWKESSIFHMRVSPGQTVTKSNVVSFVVPEAGILVSMIS